MDNLDIKSSTIDKGLELIKDFVGKLITPAIEETGLLFGDMIKFVRFKQQVKILSLAKQYAEDRKINIKSIPVKILVPLLENASLEENEEMQDKWAKMITNMADSESNLQNQIFPYLLSQISLSEFEGLKQLIQSDKEFYRLREELSEIKKDKGISSITIEKLQKNVDSMEQEGYRVDLNEEYEYANLIRLGLIKQLPPRIYIEDLHTGSSYGEEPREEWHRINAQYEGDGAGYKITELGMSFVDICELYNK